MSAKELFKELGYECDISCDGILYSKYKDLPNGGVAHCYIDFDKVNKIVEKDESQAGFGQKHYNSKITLEELQAINKQVEELWGDNNEN